MLDNGTGRTMATELEIQQALQIEHNKAALALADRAFQAIDSVTNIGNRWLAVLSIELAVLALIGLAVVLVGARRQARKVAESRIDAYIDTDEGKGMIRAAIVDEVAGQLEARAFIVVHPASAHPEPGEPSFPEDPPAKKGGGK